MDLSELLRAIGAPYQQGWQKYQENIGEPVGGAMAGFGRGLLGLERPDYGGEWGEAGYKVGVPVGLNPVVQAPVGAAKVAAKGIAGLLDVAQGLKGIDLAGLLGLLGYHGSGVNTIKKFDPAFIGTGEGAQAYGHGFYLAESPDVGRGYKERIAANTYTDKSGNIIAKSGELWELARDDVARASGLHPDQAGTIADHVQQWVDSGRKAGTFLKHRMVEKQYIPAYQAAMRTFSGVLPNKGSLYTIDIPDEMIAKMLNWDNPLNQQSQKTQQAIYNNLVDAGYPKQVVNDLLNRKTGADVYRMLYKGMEQGDESAINLASALVNLDKGLFMSAPALASESLRQIGIPGIRYWDEMSRRGRAGTSNFVVFPGEEGLLKIINRE